MKRKYRLSALFFSGMQCLAKIIFIFIKLTLCTFLPYTFSLRNVKSNCEEFLTNNKFINYWSRIIIELNLF